MSASERQLSHDERRAAFSDNERELARVQLRVAAAEFVRAEAAYKAAVKARKDAVVAAERVGVSVREMGDDLCRNRGLVSQLLRSAAGERAPKS